MSALYTARDVTVLRGPRRLLDGLSLDVMTGELLAVKATHAGLYALLLLLPLSGWLMATTTPVRVPTIVFGLFALPYPLAPDLATYRVAHAVHVTAAILLALLVFLHSAAALAHAWRGRRPIRRNTVQMRARSP